MVLVTIFLALNENESDVANYTLFCVQAMQFIEFYDGDFEKKMYLCLIEKYLFL